LFAVCAAESYIFEWVRDTVLKNDFSVLPTYFPFPQSGERKPGVREKFKDIPKRLFEDRRINKPLDCGAREWQDFVDLVDWRDGLVHARASRPEMSGQPEKERPVPSKGELDKLKPGWALAVVRTLLNKLHRYGYPTSGLANAGLKAGLSGLFGLDPPFAPGTSQ
jgi:hypothetical protein